MRRRPINMMRGGRVLGYAEGGAANMSPNAGFLAPGNIDLNSRPVVRNPDGSISTVRSMSAEFDGREHLIPTISDDGRVLSHDAAIDQYKNTGRHLGIFDNPGNATDYAESLHRDQERMYAPRASGGRAVRRPRNMMKGGRVL